MPIHLAWPLNPTANEIPCDFLLGLGPKSGVAAGGFITQRAADSYAVQFNCGATANAFALVITPAPSQWIGRHQWLMPVTIDWGAGPTEFPAHFDTGFSDLALPLFKSDTGLRHALDEYVDMVACRAKSGGANPILKLGQFDPASYVHICISDTCNAMVENHRDTCLICGANQPPVDEPETRAIFVLDQCTLPPIVVALGARRYEIPMDTLLGKQISLGGHNYRPLNIFTLPIASRDFVIGLPILLAIMAVGPIHWRA